MKKSNDKVHNIVNNTNITQGNVKITIKNNNGKKLNEISTHNSGTQELCKYIRDIMSGEYSPIDRPGSIVPCRYNSSQTYAAEHNLIDMFSTPIKADPIDGSAEEGEGTDDDSWASIRLSCIIPDSVLSFGDEIGGFRLYSLSTPKKEYAWIDIHNTPITVPANSNLEVEWTLKVSPFNKN